MGKPKHQRGKVAKSSAPAQVKSERSGEATAGEASSADPLRAFPADPPVRNRRLLIISAILFVAWFCYLAYVALKT
jgi:hypothetical protein